MIIFIKQAIIGTPWWVWVVFFYLLFVGMQATKKRVVYLPKLFIVPAILMVSKYALFFHMNTQMILVYFVSILVAATMGYLLAARENIRVIIGEMSVELPGNIRTLILFMLFFAVKYVFGYLYATQPALASQFFVWEIGINGLFSGYFLGSALNYMMRFMQES